jgi:hypothetical protein
MAPPQHILDVDNVRIFSYHSRTLNSDGSENRKSPKDRGEDERSESAGFLPGDVTCRIFGSDSSGVANLQESRSQVTKGQRQLIAASGLLQNIPYPGHFDAKGTEHTVRFRGRLVEKHQHSDGWTAFLNDAGLLSIRPALPTEYLRRMEFQNELFGDQIHVVGLTRANRFVITQPTLRGGEPSENEIRDLLLDSGWQRVPINLQNLPSQLMGTAWWHEHEELVLVDARKPNFKKTDFGILPIDLVFSDLSADLLNRIGAG